MNKEISKETETKTDSEQEKTETQPVAPAECPPATSCDVPQRPDQDEKGEEIKPAE